MSGHNKWSTIKHRKAAQDAKRGQAFTKIIRELTVAARAGGGDEDTNPRLRVAIQAAKDSNMPKDTMERAIKKGSGDLEGVSYEDVIYEGYGPGGVAIFVEASTDNKNRSAAEFRHIFTRYNGNMGEVGCVGWMFNKKGQIVIPREGTDEELVMEAALEAGAQDIQTEDDALIVECEWTEMMDVRKALEDAGLTISSAEVTMVPDNTVPVEGKDAETLMKLINALEEMDDVNTVSANFDIDEAVMDNLMS